jgi:hypothetical protein
MFTKQELGIVLQLIRNTEIKGGDAFIVAQLLQKIEQLLKAPEAKQEDQE